MALRKYQSKIKNVAWFYKSGFCNINRFFIEHNIIRETIHTVKGKLNQ